MDLLVYSLCSLLSAFCAFMLVRAYRSSRMRLLLWSSMSFIGLALANFALFADLVMFPESISLVPIRLFITLFSVLPLLFGIIWEMN